MCFIPYRHSGNADCSVKHGYTTSDCSVKHGYTKSDCSVKHGYTTSYDVICGTFCVEQLDMTHFTAVDTAGVRCNPHKIFCHPSLQTEYCCGDISSFLFQCYFPVDNKISTRYENRKTWNACLQYIFRQ